MSVAITTSTCPMCHEIFESAQGRVYCSSKCRSREHRRREGADQRPPDTVKYRDEVLKRLARNESQQAIADDLGISRRSVGIIAGSVTESVRRRTLLVGIRCPTCGGAVKEIPCRLCEVRNEV